jgi:hypothetical protein
MAQMALDLLLLSEVAAKSGPLKTTASASGLIRQKPLFTLNVRVRAVCFFFFFFLNEFIMRSSN